MVVCVKHPTTKIKMQAVEILAWNRLWNLMKCAALLRHSPSIIKPMKSTKILSRWPFSMARSSLLAYLIGNKLLKSLLGTEELAAP